MVPNMTKIIFKVLIIALVITASSGANAQDLNQQQQQLFATITGKVMSPYCPGKLLSDCPSGKASELKSILRDKITSGASEADLMTYLEDQYGKETIQSAPGTKGFDVFAWITPFAFLLVGAVLFWKWLKNWSNTSVNNVSLGINLSDSNQDSLSQVADRAKKELGI
jgi:cytochrome c-type biogenesis protein CcmH